MRVYRTQVDDRGEFSLRALNDPVTGPDFALLDFYRVFWDHLLTAKPARGDRLNAPRAEARSAWRQGAESLRTILESAERWLFALLEEARKPAADVRRLSSLMRVKITVQNDLRRHAENFPQLAPVSRYLIVRLVSVRTGTLREHLDDLSGLLETFENAVALLTAASAVSISERREHVATA
jgi:hypothetical protein